MIAQEVTKAANTFGCPRLKRLSGHGQFGGRIRVASGLVLDLVVRYSRSVASKKDAIGIGLPKHSCDESRSFRNRNAALSFVPQVFGGSMGGRKPGRFPQGVPGRPTCRAAASDWSQERWFLQTALLGGLHG